MANSYPTTFPCTIENDAAASEVINLGGKTLVGLEIPAEFDGAAITIAASVLHPTLVKDVYDTEGTLMTIDAAASHYIAVNPVATHGFVFVRLTSDTNQSGGNTIITLVVRDMSS